MRNHCFIVFLFFQLALRAQNRELIIPTGHPASIVKLVFSPDGGLLASASTDGTVKIWDTRQFLEMSNFKQDSGFSQNLFFDTTGRYLYSSCNSGFIKFDAANNILLYKINLGVNAKTIYPIDNSSALVFTRNLSLNLLELNTKTLTPLINSGLRAVSNYDKATRTFAAAGLDGSLMLYKLNAAKTGYPDARILRNHFIHGRIIKRKREANPPDVQVILSENAQYICVIKNTNLCKFYDLGRYKVKFRAEASTSGNLQPQTMMFCDSLPVVGLSGGKIAVWSMTSFRQLKTLDNHYGEVLCLAANKFTGRMASGGSDRSIVLWKLPEFKPLARIYGLSPQINCAVYSPGRNIILGGDITGKIRNIGFKEFIPPTTKSIFTAREIYGLQLSRDNKNILIQSPPSTYTSYSLENLDSKKVIYTIRTKKACYLDAGGSVIREGAWWVAKPRPFVLFDAKTLKKTLKIADKPERYYSQITTVPPRDVDYPLQISLDKEGPLKLIPEGNGNEVQYIPIEDNDYVYRTKEGYYYCTNAALKVLHFNQDGKIYSFDQFDLQFNRPDIVLKQLGSKDSVLISSYYRAYQKRLRKMHFTEGMFSDNYHVPELNIPGKDTISATTNHPSIKIRFYAFDSLYRLDRINVYVNDVPVNGVNGIDLRNQNTSVVDSSLQIMLTPGLNKVDLSCQNDKSVESYKETFTVTYQPAKAWAEPKTYFVGIGVSNYKNPAYHLTYPVKDIRDMATALKASVKNLVIDTLFNENATRENILKIKQKLLNANINDKVILSLSGHGLLSDSLDFYYGTYDVDAKHPEVRGLAYDDLENILDSIPPRKKLLLMDACHSGEVDKEENGGEAVASAGNGYGTSPKGVVKKELVFSGANNHLGLQNTYKLMKDMFADLNRGNGASVISAAAGDEYALESPKWKNGVFTYSILLALKQKKEITISQLKDFVSGQVELLTNGAQKPTSRQENMDFDWRIK